MYATGAVPHRVAQGAKRLCGESRVFLGPPRHGVDLAIEELVFGAALPLDGDIVGVGVAVKAPAGEH